MTEHPHVTLVRQGYAAFSAFDVEGLHKLIAEDCVMHVAGDNIISGETKGFDAIMGEFGRLGAETQGTLHVELEHLLTDGHGKVLTVHRFTGTRKGHSVDFREGLVFEIVDGQARSMTLCAEDLEEFDRFWA